MTTVIIKLIVATIAGGLLGLEREAKHKPLGLKTCIVISVTSCLLTIVSIEVAISPYTSQLVRADPMRLAAQIVSGVGFLGAGVILRKNNDAISGLTTAAIVWAASGLGIAVGAGYYFETLLGVGLIFLGIKFMPFLMRKVGPRAMREQGVKIVLQVAKDIPIQEVIRKIRSFDICFKDIQISGGKETYKLILHCTILEQDDFIFMIYEKVWSIPGVDTVEIEEL